MTFWIAVVVGPAFSAARELAAAAGTAAGIAPLAGIDTTARAASVPTATCPAWTLMRASTKKLSSGSPMSAVYGAPIGSAVVAAGTCTAVNAGCSAAVTSCTAAAIEADVTCAEAICADVTAAVGTTPSTRCVISDVSGLMLAVSVVDAFAGAIAADSCAGVPSTSLNGTVSTSGATPVRLTEYLPLASVTADCALRPELSVIVTTTPTRGAPAAATPETEYAAGAAGVLSESPEQAASVQRTVVARVPELRAARRRCMAVPPVGRPRHGAAVRRITPPCDSMMACRHHRVGWRCTQTTSPPPPNP